MMHHTRKRTVGQRGTNAFSAFTSRKAIGILSLVLIVILPITIFLARQPHSRETRAATNGQVYYVSKNGTNGDGLSWATAWNELNRINWSLIQPGDTILLDGGSSQMVYTTTLAIGASGTQSSPITIARATESGHNGQVIIDGGRNAPLPYCGQPANTYQSNEPVLSDGISFDINSYVVVDGMSWHGIVVRNAGWQGGVIFRSYYPIPSPGTQLPYAHDDTLRNMEIYNNGTTQTYTTPGTLATAGFGVTPSGRNLTFEYMDIHDNGDDSFYSGGPIDGMVVRYSWLHNARAYPGHPGTSYDLCVHTEPLQTSSTYGASSMVNFENDVFGPGISNGVINSPGAYVNNLTLKNVLTLDGGSHEIFPDSPAVQQWTIDHVTSFGQAGNLELAGQNHTVTNSIFYDGHVQTINYNPGGPLDGVNSVTTAANNCQWHTDNNPSFINAKVADPQFVTDLSSYPPYLNIDDPPIYATDSWPTLAFLTNSADFSLKPGSPCAGMGSAITSVSQFLSIVNNQNPTPTPTVPTGTTPTSTPQGQVSPTLTPVPTTLSTPTPPNGAFILYDNAVSPLFNDYSFAFSARNPCDTSTFVSPPCSYAITYNGYGGINFSVPANPGSISTAVYQTLEWNLNPNKQPIQDFSAVMTFTDGSYTQIPLSKALVSTAHARGWRHISVLVSQLNPYNKPVTSIQLKNSTSGPLAQIHVDDVYLM